MEFKFNESEKLNIVRNKDGKFRIQLKGEYDGYCVYGVNTIQLFKLKQKLDEFLMEDFSDEINDLETCNGLNIFFEEES